MSDVVDEILTKMKKTFKRKVVLLSELDEFSSVKNWTSSGVPELDLLCQTFGYPPGLTEIAGDPQSGKTTLALHFIKEMQRRGGMPISVSTERRDNKRYAEEVGVDTSRVPVFRTRTIEGSFDWVEQNIELVRSVDRKIPIGIVWDSLGGTPSRAELEANSEKEFMAVAARAIKRNLRRLTQKFDDSEITMIIVNQTYAKIGMMFGKKKTSYGGDAVKFHSQMRFETDRVGSIVLPQGKFKKQIGQKTRIEIIKSDFSPPSQKVDVDLLYGYGYVPTKETLIGLRKSGFLKKNGDNGFYVKAIPRFSWEGMNEYYQLCMNEPTFRQMIRHMAKKRIHEQIMISRGMA